MANKNPHNLCTWNTQSDCDKCANLDILDCKWDRNRLIGFILLFLPFGFTAWFGIALTGKLMDNWLALIAYAIFYIAFFLFFEIRILCSHCPYYGEESRILHCLANNGAIKIWRYHPEPMNRFEKISLVICFFFLGAYPVLVQAYGVWLVYAQYELYGFIGLMGMAGIAVATLATAVTFFACLRIYVCSRCVNFSCPLSKVPKSTVDEYLRKNPVMNSAWEQSGYILDGN